MKPDLVDLLKNKGMRRADLARAMSVHKATVTRWVKDGVPLARLNQVSKETGIPQSELRPDFFEEARQ